MSKKISKELLDRCNELLGEADGHNVWAGSIHEHATLEDVLSQLDDVRNDIRGKMSDLEDLDCDFGDLIDDLEAADESEDEDAQ